MKIFNVHIYREMRLVFKGIEATSHEAAASIAHDKPTDEADDIADCEGENLSALVDVQGDEEYEHSRVIDLEPAVQRQAALKLLAALASLTVQADEDCPAGCRSRHFTDAMEDARAAIAEANTCGIASPSTAAPGVDHE
jgi:hypothetical protein